MTSAAINLLALLAISLLILAILLFAYFVARRLSAAAKSDLDAIDIPLDELRADPIPRHFVASDVVDAQATDHDDGPPRAA
jgi:hypothetical protein